MDAKIPNYPYKYRPVAVVDSCAEARKFSSTAAILLHQDGSRSPSSFWMGPMEPPLIFFLYSFCFLFFFIVLVWHTGAVRLSSAALLWWFCHCCMLRRVQWPINMGKILNQNVQINWDGGVASSPSHMRPLPHPGHSVRPNRSVRFLGHSVSSVIRNLGPIGLCKKRRPRKFGLG